MKLAIAIPARYGSTRFLGKPLALIADMTMLERVYRTAQSVREKHPNIDIFIATDDKRIVDHANEIAAPCIITPPSAPTGSDRILSALRQLDNWPDFVINLQGDAPFTPPAVISQILDTYSASPELEVVTPIHNLTWADLDRLRTTKQKTPYSGTTTVINAQGRALWFSKNIIPAIRQESDLRKRDLFSPVYQHIGLYGFRTDILEKFCALPEGIYEKLEGLEQLRMIENGIAIQTVRVDIPEGEIQSGIDSPEDINRAEEYIKTYGDPHR